MSKCIGSRVGRREQLSQQERLIEQRRREIEKKMSEADREDRESNEDNIDIKDSKESIELICEQKDRQMSNEVKTEMEAKSDNDIKSEVKPTSSSAANEESTSTPVVNKFANDGSFFEQFLRMQKNIEPKDESIVVSIVSEESEQKDTKQGIKAIKMVLKENTSKLRAVSSVDGSTVRLSDDDDYKEDKDIQMAIERTAISVTMNGIQAEESMRQTRAEDSLYSWLKDKESDNYRFYEKRVQELGEAKVRAQNDGLFIDEEAETSSSSTSKKPRKSRWSEDKVEHRLNDPALVQYAIQVFGNTDLTADQWKQLEDQRKMKMLFEMLQKKQRANQMLANAGKVKYDYDSDEDTTDGTWEHKRRRLEMEETQRLAEQLTEKASGKHHIGDFMPPEELERFMQKWEAVNKGMPVSPDSDYKDSTIQSDNVGFKMLKKLGWVEGHGLGAEGSGRAAPVNKSIGGVNNAGLGQIRPEDLKEGDDEYEAYRKRMMLAYRFRPNPLNNPRRAYY